MIGKKHHAGKFCLAYAKLSGVRLFRNSGVLIGIGKSKVTACQKRFCISFIAKQLQKSKGLFITDVKGAKSSINNEK